MRVRGFTIIELVITLAIIGLLASAAMPLANLVAQREKESELRRALRELRDGLDAYKRAADGGHIQLEVGASGYPADLRALYQGVDDMTSEKKIKMYFLRHIPRDPFYPDGSVTAEDTWGLRSYQSTPEDPQPGEDVYDVHSMSTIIGLNGVAYRDW
jgi:general secretion pathway protein G